MEIVSSFSRDEEGWPFYTTHLNYLRHLFGIVKEGGSVLCEHPFARTAVERATQFPTKLFEVLDDDWKEYAQKIHSGRLGLVIPPLLSIVLNNCARRDAIPAVVKDLRRDWAGARGKIWQLVEDQKNARTLKEINDIQHELAEASKSFSLTNRAEGSSPIRMLWDIFAAASGGAVTAKLAGGNATIGAVSKAVTQIIGSAADAQALFHFRCLRFSWACSKCGSSGRPRARYLVTAPQRFGKAGSRIHEPHLENPPQNTDCSGVCMASSLHAYTGTFAFLLCLELIFLRRVVGFEGREGAFDPFRRRMHVALRDHDAGVTRDFLD